MKSSIQKAAGKTILVGLIVGLLPLPVYGQLEKLPIQKKQIKTTFTQKNIDQTIATLKKTIKGLRIINYVATAATIGIGGIAIGGGVLLSVGSIIAMVMFPPGAFVSFAVTGLTIPTSALVLGIVSSIASGLLTAQATLAVFGGLSATIILSALIGAKQLETIEKDNPGSLTTKQKKTLEQFRAIVRGPILQGIVKGLQLKKMYKDQAKKALVENPELINSFATKEKALKTVQYYIKNQLKLTRLNEVVAQFNQKIEKQQESRNRHNKWTPIYHTKNAQLIALKLDIKFGLAKAYLKKAQKRERKLNTMYPNIESMIEEVIEETEEKTNEIMQTYNK